MVKRKTKNDDEDIDWEDIKWGSFTAQFKRYKQQHKYSKMKDLKQFAKYILKNKKRFHSRTEKRANFYINVILKRKKKKKK